MARTWDVIVLGVGAMGSAACWRLATRGVRVLGLEQFALGHDRGSAHGQSRLIRQAYFEHPDYVPLLRGAYALWDELSTIARKPLLQRTGLALYGPAQGPIVAGTLKAAEIHGIPVQVHDGLAAREAFPMFRPPEDFRLVFEPGAGWLAVDECVVAMAEAAQSHGATIQTGERVLGWRPEGEGVVVTTDRDTYRADRLVVTTGAWSGPLLADLGVRLSIHRNVVLWLRANPGHEHAPCFGFDLPSGFFYGFPQLDARGVKLAHHHPGPPTLPDAVDRSLQPEDAAPVLDCARAVLPLLHPEVTDHASCLYEMSPDEHFLLDRHPHLPQVSLGAGFSGHGFKFAPVVGEVLADLALHGTTAWPAQFLGLQRFAG
jgi:sarcosine oxidase